MDFAPVSRTNAASDGFRHGLVELMRDDAANVVSLEDLAQVRHFVPAF